MSAIVGVWAYWACPLFDQSWWLSLSGSPAGQLTSLVGCEVRAATSASGTTAACHSCTSCSWPEHAGAELAMALQSSKLLCSCQPALQLLTLCSRWLVDASQAGSEGLA